MRAPLALLALAVSACVSPVPDDAGRYATPIGTAPVTGNETPYSAMLDCLNARLPEGRPRIAVGEIKDYTGKYADYSGAQVTQGAALMAMSALARLGLPMVERYDLEIARTELKLANTNLIGDDGAVRAVRAASIEGSDFFLVGGITELNYNIRSVAADAFYAQGGLGGRLYVLNIALDLRLVETRSLRVREVVSVQKQILGRELQAGIFEFFGQNLLDISLQERALEPMQLAVRAMIETSAGEMARRLFGLDPATCAPIVNEADASPTSGD